ncbi:MAG TPA: TetR family transcriptional regulator [Micromonosporaceae bacterium]|nr:TetR family transcriptional regulator [Micromonosporaceae bacterium]
MNETSPVTTAAGDGAATKGTARGEQTRRLIVDTALRLFREQGYGRTTMRAIAREAGVAVGNAYYYFPSKEHLIQEFYLGVQAEHRAAAAAALRDEKAFAARLRAVLHAGIDVNTPYHTFAATFFKTAAEPASPLSPFSVESAAPRAAAVAMFREVVEDSTVRVDKELRGELPELLWLAYLGVILYWVHDRSPAQTRTRTLIDGAVPLIDKLVGLSRLPGLRAVIREALGLIRALRQ